MDSILSYINFRDFLKDYYTEQKENFSYFSYRYFSQKAGIKSPVFLKEVYDGKKNLSSTMIEKFCKVLKFNAKETKYFRILVHFNQAKTSDEKQEYYTHLKTMVDTVEQHVLKSDFYVYYDKWYTSVIREIVTQMKYKNNLDELANKVYPPISRKEAKESLKLLVDLNFIKRNRKGYYEQTQKDITTGSEIASHIIRQHNRQMLKLADNAIENVPVDRRFSKGITMGIDRAAYDLILAETEAYKDRIISIVNNCKAPDEVYELYLQLFPLSKNFEEEQIPDEEDA